MKLWTAHWDALSVLVQSRACFPSSVRENIMKAPASSAARSPKRPAPRRSLIGKKETPPASAGGVFLSLLSMQFTVSSKKYKRNEKKMEKSVDKREKRRYTNQAVPRGTVRIGKTGQELRKTSKNFEKSSWQRDSDLIELSSCTSQDANEINGSRLNPKEILKKVVDKREWVW